MSQTRSYLMSAVRTLCGEPSDAQLPDGLPSNLIFEELLTTESIMLRDLEMGAQERRIVQQEVTINASDEVIGVPWDDYHSAAYAYLQESGSDIWWPVDIVSEAALAQAGIDGRLAVSFTGTPQQLRFSWLPDDVQTLRIWYERGAEAQPTMAGSTELGGLYDDYLKLQTAAQCREHLKLPVGDVMRSRLDKSERQWQRYVHRGSQRGAAQKTPVYTPPRFRGRRLDRTRYFTG